MYLRNGIDIVAIVLGLIMVAFGASCIFFPRETVIFHSPAEETRAFLEWVSPAGMKFYGFLEVLGGLFLIWFTSGPAWLGKNLAIEQYVWCLSQDLSRRFGIQNSYTIRQVTQTAELNGYSKRFLVHAHAFFCTGTDFDEYYKPSRFLATYNRLRRILSRRYFGGAQNFNAATLIRMTREPNPEAVNFCEGGAG